MDLRLRSAADKCKMTCQRTVQAPDRMDSGKNLNLNRNITEI